MRRTPVVLPVLLVRVVAVSDGAGSTIGVKGMLAARVEAAKAAPALDQQT